VLGGRIGIREGRARPMGRLVFVSFFLAYSVCQDSAPMRENDFFSKNGGRLCFCFPFLRTCLSLSYISHGDESCKPRICLSI
jgi:hypothetical protein